MDQTQSTPEKPPVGFYVFVGLVGAISLLVAGYLVYTYFV